MIGDVPTSVLSFEPFDIREDSARLTERTGNKKNNIKLTVECVVSVCKQMFVRLLFVSYALVPEVWKTTNSFEIKLVLFGFTGFRVSMDFFCF